MIVPSHRLHVITLNCLDRVVLSHHSELWQHFRSVFMSAAIGPTEINRDTDCATRIWGKKICHMKNNDNFVSRELQRASTKTYKIFTLYHPELMKKRPVLCTFCTQSVTRGLTRLLS